jgi:hypothetical protein
MNGRKPRQVTQEPDRVNLTPKPLIFQPHSSWKGLRCNLVELNALYNMYANAEFSISGSGELLR